MFDRGFFLTWQAIRRQLAAMPHDLFLIRLIHYATQKPCPGERLWTARQLVHGPVVRFLRQRNCQGYDVYIVPYAEKDNSGYILLDLDRAPAQVVARMRGNGHEPCVVIQTSAGHLQAWIRLSTTPLQPALATAIAKQLAHTYQADLASTDWRHLGRLAGFTNQKLARRTAAGYAPWVKVLQARPVLASAARDLLQALRQPLVSGLSSATTNQAFPLARSPAITDKERSPSISAGSSVGTFASAFHNPIGASSICGWPDNCSPNTHRPHRSKPFSVWAVPTFPASTMIRRTICAALWPAPLFLLPALLSHSCRGSCLAHAGP